MEYKSKHKTFKLIDSLINPKYMKNEIVEILEHNVNYYVMLRDLDGQYQQCLSEMIHKAAEEISRLTKPGTGEKLSVENLEEGDIVDIVVRKKHIKLSGQSTIMSDRENIIYFAHPGEGLSNKD